MKGEKDKWLEGLRSSLEGFECDAPEISWEAVTAAGTKKRRGPVFLWSAVAAAAVIAGVFIFKPEMPDSPEEVILISETALPENISKEDIIQEQIEEEKPREMFVKPQVVRREKLLAKSIAEEEGAEQEGETVQTEERVGESEQSGTVVKKVAEKRKEVRRTEVFNFSERAEKRRSFSGKLYYANTLGGTQANFGIRENDGIQYSAEPVHPVLFMAAKNNGSAPRTEISHRMPVKIGVSVRYGIDRKWSVESGLYWSMLRSDIRKINFGSLTRESKQVLNYVGLPLKVNYSVFQKPNLLLYVSAGGAVEKMVSGQLSTLSLINNKKDTRVVEDVDIKQHQLSANIGAGLEFLLFKNIGLYFEPGLSYYFKNESTVETFYSENPLNFSVDLGLRLAF